MPKCESCLIRLKFHSRLFVQVTCRLLGVILEESTPEELQVRDDVPVSVEILYENSSLERDYLMDFNLGRSGLL